MTTLKDVQPGFTELHIAKVSDGTYILRTDNQLVVTAQNFNQVKKRLAEFFVDERDAQES